MLPLPSSSSAPCYLTYSSPRHRRGYARPRKLQVGGGRESHRQFRRAFPGKVTLWGALIEAVARREKRHRKRSPYPPPRTAFRMRGGFRMVRRSSQTHLTMGDVHRNALACKRFRGTGPSGGPKHKQGTRLHDVVNPVTYYRRSHIHDCHAGVHWQREVWVLPGFGHLLFSSTPGADSPRRCRILRARCHAHLHDLCNMAFEQCPRC